MQHCLLAQQAQQQHRGMDFITICLNDNNMEAGGQLPRLKGLNVQTSDNRLRPQHSWEMRILGDLSRCTALATSK